MRNILAILGLLLVIAAGVHAYEINWSTIDGGGGSSAGGGYAMSGTIAQPDAGVPLTGSGYELVGGFWTVGLTQPPTAMSGDCDIDGDIDLLDFGQFQVCFTGMDAGPYADGCACSDFDGDGDVDLLDFGQFQLAFTG